MKESTMKETTMNQLLGPFNDKAEVCQCVILLEQEPNHFKILARFQSHADCLDAFNMWKNGE